MRAEKFIEKNEYEDILIRVFKIKEIKFDVDHLIDIINEIVRDDYESLFEAGVIYNFDELYYLEVNAILVTLNTYLFDNEEDSYTKDGAKKFVELLEEYVGYTIYV
jgi:hypothetical protein